MVLEKTLESSLDSKEVKPVNPKGNQPWIFIGRTEAEAPIRWLPDAKKWLIRKRPWCWEGLKAKGEGDNRGRDGWMASLTQRTWVWASSGRWWRTGKHGRATVPGVTKSWIQMSEWTTIKQLLPDTICVRILVIWAKREGMRFKKQKCRYYSSLKQLHPIRQVVLCSYLSLLL